MHVVCLLILVVFSYREYVWTDDEGELHVFQLTGHRGIQRSVHAHRLSLLGQHLSSQYILVQ